MQELARPYRILGVLSRRFCLAALSGFIGSQAMDARDFRFPSVTHVIDSHGSQLLQRGVRYSRIGNLDARQFQAHCRPGSLKVEVT